VASIFRFTIEGRAAPALFVLGWLATIVGGGTLAVAIFSGPTVVGAALFLTGAVGLTVGLGALAGSQAVEGRAATVAGYRGPSPVLLFLAWVPAAYVGWVSIGLPLEAAGVVLSGPPAEFLYLVVQTAVAVGLVRLLVVGPGALTWRQIGFGRTGGAATRDAAWGALLAGPTIMVTALVAAALVSLTNVAPESPLPPTGTAGGFVLHLLAGALVAPVAEEILFRGVAVSAWSASVGARSAIIRSALLFAAAHVLTVGGDSFSTALALAFVGFVGRLPIALVLGWVFVRRGSIWAPLGLHAAYNGVLIAAAELLAAS
jgi:membrane protease YdiL (CAAX protease family)